MVNKYGKPDYEYEKPTKDKFNDNFYECLQNIFCGGWKSRWGNTTNGLDGLITLELRGAARGTGFIGLAYESAVFSTALNQEEARKSRSDQDAL